MVEVLADPQRGGFKVATVLDQPEHVMRRAGRACRREAESILAGFETAF